MTLWSWLFRGWHVSTEKSRARAAAEAARPKPGRPIPASQYMEMMQQMSGNTYQSDGALLRLLDATRAAQNQRRTPNE